MYRLEISADSPKELMKKLLDFTQEYIASNSVPPVPEYLNEPDLPDNEFPFGVPVNAVPLAKKEEFRAQMSFDTANLGVSTSELTGAPTTAVAVTHEQLNAQARRELLQKEAVADTTRDSRGFLWDSRIHSSSKKMTNEGVWCRRRGVDSEYLEKIEAEILGKPYTPPVVVNEPSITHVSSTSPILPPSEMSTVPAHSLQSFKTGITTLLTQLINSKKITTEYVAELKKHFGIEQIWHIVDNEANCLALYELFAQLGFITKVVQ